MAGKRILLVEGVDDENVMKHICGNRNISHFDEIKKLESVEKLLEHVPTRLKACNDGEIVGVVIDADTDIAARWQSLRDRLMGVGYLDIPENPLPAGTIVDAPAGGMLPRVGIWIMPDNRTTGNLEHFLRFLIPAGSGLYQHVEKSVDGIPPSERRFGESDSLKALIHTWLAWQKDPGVPYGTAITSKFLDPNVAEVDVLVSWITRLFFP